MSFEIRLAEPNEADKLKAFMKEIIPSETPFGDEVWRNNKVDAYWVFIDEERAGMVVYQFDAGVGATYDQLELPSAPGQMYLLFVGLVEKWRGGGYGTEIVRLFILKAKRQRDIKRVVSNIRVDDTISEKAHLRAGFRRGEIKKDYYGFYKHSLVLHLELPTQA